MRDTDVEDAMTRDVVACRMDDSLEHVARLLYEADVACAPVLERRGRRVVGLVGARDLCAAVVRGGGRLEGIRVEAVMREKVATCWPDDSLESAEAVMRAYRVRRLPVVDAADRLLGIVSLSDIARRVAGHSERTEEETREVLETLAEIDQRQD